MNTGAIVAIVGILFLAGIGGGYWYLSSSRSAAPGIDAVADHADGETHRDDAESGVHGSMPAIPAGAPMCETHKVPELICAFCDPTLVEKYGYCSGHDVAEVLCTRCHPEMIAAFKAENDWCAEHGLPESQCAICNPPSNDG